MRVAKLIRPLLDSPCWRIRYDSQLGLDLSFGEPYLEIREPRQSKSKLPSIREHFARRGAVLSASCWLWIRSAHWTITVGNGCRANWSTSARKRGIAFSMLQGEKVTGVIIEPNTGRTTFLFDLGGVLVARRIGRAANDTLWTLYKPNGYCLAVRSDGHYSHSECSASFDAWSPVK